MPKGAAASTRLLASPRGVAWSKRNFQRAWDRVELRANLILARAIPRSRGGLPGRTQPEQRAQAKAAVRAQLLDAVQRRALRRTGTVQMAIAGATTPQIAAVAGWKIEYTQKIIDTYLPRRPEVALGAVEKWEAAPPTNVVLLPSPKARKAAR